MFWSTLSLHQLDLGFDVGKFINLAFPDKNDLPAKFFQFGLLEFVSFDISPELFFPELLVGRWHCCLRTSFVSMPKTTVNENNCLILRQDYIRLSRKIFHMQTKTIASAMQCGSDVHFRLRIFRSNPAHVPASFF